MSEQRRPWCLPCRQEDGSRAWAAILGVVCEWHWGILEKSDQRALQAAVKARHPRGGRVANVIEQIVIVRRDLRGGDNTIEQTWRDDWASVQADNPA